MSHKARSFMRRLWSGGAILLALIGLLAGPQEALGLDHGCGGRQTWSDGSDVKNAYGVMGTMYAYPRPSVGAKVNSMYVRNPDLPNHWGVEVGYSATGLYAPPPLPWSRDPWMFSARMKNGDYSVKDFGYLLPFPVNQRTTVSLQRRGNDDWDIYYGSTLVDTWWDMPQLIQGTPTAAEERDVHSVDPRASITWMKTKMSSGSWVYWWHGKTNGVAGPAADTLNPAFRFRFNRVGDSNHWVYCDDKDN